MIQSLPVRAALSICLIMLSFLLQGQSPACGANKADLEKMERALQPATEEMKRFVPNTVLYSDPAGIVLVSEPSGGFVQLSNCAYSAEESVTLWRCNSPEDAEKFCESLVRQDIESRNKWDAKGVDDYQQGFISALKGVKVHQSLFDYHSHRNIPADGPAGSLKDSDQRNLSYADTSWTWRYNRYVARVNTVYGVSYGRDDRPDGARGGTREQRIARVEALAKAVQMGMEKEFVDSAPTPDWTTATEAPPSPPPPGKPQSIIPAVLAAAAVIAAIAAAIHQAAKKKPPQDDRQPQEKQESQVHYVLLLSENRIRISYDNPAHLRVSAWCVDESSGYRKAPEATLQIAPASEGSGLSIAPSHGQGEISCTVTLSQMTTLEEAQLTVTATAGGVQTSAKVKVTVESPYEMVFY